MEKDKNKAFENTFNSLARKYGSYDVFDTLLDLAINSLSFNYDSRIIEVIRKKYTQEEKYNFGELIKYWILIMKDKVRNNKYFDFWGHFYELNAMSKEKGFAQYFTPDDVCKLMVQISLMNNSESKRVYEPTCGSGRLNLAINSIQPNMYHIASDLDITCAKMSALNFFIHGIRGVVICDDALIAKSKFRGAFIINENNKLGINYCSDKDIIYKHINFFNETSLPSSIIHPVNQNNKELVKKQLSLF